MLIIEKIKTGVSGLSSIGRALMLPISLLPAAGLLPAFGDKLGIDLMTRAGGAIFDNLPLLFAICYLLFAICYLLLVQQWGLLLNLV